MFSPEAFAADLAGTAINMAFQDKQRKAAYKYQEKFAKHGVRWRVADAQAAGIHPLAALGMSPNQATPVTIGADPGEPLQKQAARMYDAQMQNQVMQGEKYRAEAALAMSQKALNSLEYNAKNLEYQRKLKSIGKELYVKYFDNIQAFPKVNGKPVTVWVLDEQAAEGMEGDMPKYMTIIGNQQLFSQTIKGLKNQVFNIK